MDYIKATKDDIDHITDLVHETIQTIYPKYYPKAIVDFFCEHHCRENIAKDIENGNVGILVVDGNIAGTGCYTDNHITRVYVAPMYQRQGYGSYIMQTMEDKIRLKYDKVYLDASLPASHLYESRGYKTTRHERLCISDGVVLVYEVMEKTLSGR